MVIYHSQTDQQTTKDNFPPTTLLYKKSVYTVYQYSSLVVSLTGIHYALPTQHQQFCYRAFFRIRF